MGTIGIDAVRLSSTRTGIENFALSILRCLPILVRRHSEWHFTVFITDEGLRVFKTEVDNTDQPQINFRKIPEDGRGWIKEQLFLPFAVGSSKKFDVFFSPGYPVSPFIFPRKLIIQVHDMVPWRWSETMTRGAGFYWRTLLPYSIKRAHTILVDSEFTAKEIEFYKFAKKENVRVFYLALDNNFLEFIEHNEANYAIQNLGIKQPYVLALGSIEPRKNLPFLLDVYECFMGKGHNYDLNLVISGGKGWKNQEIFDQISSHKFKENIFLTGWVSDEVLPHLLARAKALLFPSIYEGFGLPPLEAIALGTPAIVSNVASLPEVLGSHAFFADPHNIDDWILQMQRVINENAYNGMMQSGKKWASNYSQENLLLRLEKLFLSLLS